MRFRCVIGILFFLTLKDCEGATQAACAMKNEDWIWLKLRSMKLKTCVLNIDMVNEEDFTISPDYDWKFLGLTFSSSYDQSTPGLRLHHKIGVKFLPTNIFRVFPNLVAFEFWNCSVTTVNKNHLKKLSKLTFIDLSYNKIEHVASDAFVDLVSLEELDLHGNRFQSLIANWFSPLKALKGIYLGGNKKIQHLDPEVIESLVNIEYLRFGGNSIATLDEKIFHNLTNLKEISLSGNKLKAIPRNLFKNNLKLEWIFLQRNEIKFIDANMLDHLPNRKLLIDLEDNVCVNSRYSKDWKGSFDRMRSDFKRACKPLHRSAACGEPRHAISLIVRGQNFPRGGFPWVVALLHTGWTPPKFFCGGTLISKTFVISAAHCILDKYATEKFLPQDLLALFGAHDLDNPYESERTTLPPVEIFIHEDWNHLTTNYDADISLLKFQNGSIPLSVYIQPICLWNSGTDPNVTTGVVAGWGKSEDTTKIHENLPKLIPAPILTNERCWLDDPGLITISSERTFCAGLRNGSGVCQGDSGGGHFIEVDGLYHLKGIVSSSKVTDQGCDVSRNAVYTNVLKFMDWIKEKTSQTNEE